MSRIHFKELAHMSLENDQSEICMEAQGRPDVAAQVQRQSAGRILSGVGSLNLSLKTFQLIDEIPHTHTDREYSTLLKVY